MVTRYDLEVYSQGAAGQCDIVPDPEGDYVLLADYNKLEERLLAVYAKENKTICPYCNGMGWWLQMLDKCMSVCLVKPQDLLKRILTNDCSR